MTLILNFDDRIRGHKFTKQIVEPLSRQSQYYEFMQDDFNGIAFLHYKSYVHIICKFIPRGEITSNVTMEDSLSGIREKRRVSTGEWVIKDIIVLQQKDALALFPLIYAEPKKSGWLVHFTNEIKKLVKK